MDISDYRASPAEQERTSNLLALIPAGEVALDVGARDGHFSVLLADRFDKVIALDLTKPSIEHPRVECVQGNAGDLDFPDDSIDFVFCAEVLEHIPADQLETVCRELQRVCRREILIGVPYRQDLRVGRSTCPSCRRSNPPWGHVNAFDEGRLMALFPGFKAKQTTFVGRNVESTNALSALLMDWAGNPYGTYGQEEPCIHCGAALIAPPPRRLVEKVWTRLAFWARRATSVFVRPRANWIHVLMAKQA